jgi:hypothetical protein
VLNDYQLNAAEENAVTVAVAAATVEAAMDSICSGNHNCSDNSNGNVNSDSDSNDSDSGKDDSKSNSGGRDSNSGRKNNNQLKAAAENFAMAVNVGASILLAS